MCVLVFVFVFFAFCALALRHLHEVGNLASGIHVVSHQYYSFSVVKAVLPQ